MRKMIVMVAIAFVLIAPFAAAKTALYVTQDNCAREDCGCLSGNDMKFCEQIEGLGYDVIINTEGDVKDSSTIWNVDKKKADIIFLGDVSESMLNKSEWQGVFCGNIEKAGKKVFAAGTNAYKSGDIEGCAFKLGIVSYNDDDNACTGSSVFVKSKSYVTKIYPIEEKVTVYDTAMPMSIHSKSTEVAIHCDPPGDVYKTNSYSVLEMNDIGTFWGLTDTASLTDKAWELFDRSLIYTMDDHVWTLSTKIIPEHITAGERFWVATRIYDRETPVTTGNVSLAFNAKPIGTLDYSPESEHWETIVDGITQDGELRVVAAEGSDEVSLKAGEIEVRIISGNYQPGNYTVRAVVSEEANVSYRIWDRKFVLKKEGEMEKEDDTYVAEAFLGDWGNLILEVDATANGREGGSMRTIIKGEEIKFREDYNIEPPEWIVTATKEGTVEQDFTISALKVGLSNIRVKKSGDIAESIVLNTSRLKTSLEAGEETGFTASINHTGFEEGEYRGSIIIESDEFYYKMPVNLSFWRITGDFLVIEPDEWKGMVGKNQQTTASFTLKNRANFPATGISTEVSGDITDIVGVVEEPYYVPALGEAGIVFMAMGNIVEGTYTGDIDIQSSLGSAKIAVEIEIIGDLYAEAEASLAELDLIDANLSAITWADTTELAIRSQGLKADFEDIKSYWNEGNFALAKSTYDTAAIQLGELKDEVAEIAAPPPYALVIIAIVFVVLVVLFIFVRRRLKKKAEERKKKAEEEARYRPPPEEEEYRREFY